MEKDRVQRYVQSLERTIKSDYIYLKDTIEDFRDQCRMITPEKSFPQGILVDIRETYKEIRDRLTEIKAIEQLLRGKYRQYYHRDALRDKEILEIGFIAKNCFTKVRICHQAERGIGEDQGSRESTGSQGRTKRIAV